MDTVSCILQPVFEGIRGGGFQSDIAIDDVELAPGACGKNSISFVCSMAHTHTHTHNNNNNNTVTGQVAD